MMDLNIATFDLEDLVNVEQTFFTDGYADGFAHGRVHGLVEGRALGREKGFEMWEELGFYEGFARLWAAVLDAGARGTGPQDGRAQNHIRHLLALIALFPRVNPSAATTRNSTNTESMPAESAEGASAGGGEVDIPRLFRQIRSRYKALCATLGVRPTLRATAGETDADPSSHPDVETEETTDVGASGVSVSMRSRAGAGRNVWAVHDARPAEEGKELQF